MLDALTFGDPAMPRTRRLLDGVVRGVGGYGNCVGVPTVGGELIFDPTYTANPLVNVMCLGLLRGRPSRARLPRGRADLIVLFGSTTGRDGIGGASVLASATFGGRPVAPAVGPDRRPVREKLLIEATLELVERGLGRGRAGPGRGGLSCATSEMADRGGTGIEIDLAAVPLREADMAPFEVMISESQERMCVAVRPERVDDVLEVCRRWGLPAAAVVGQVTDDGDLTVVDGGEELARIPASALASDAIVYHREAQPPPKRRDAAGAGRAATVR